MTIISKSETFGVLGGFGSTGIINLNLLREAFSMVKDTDASTVYQMIGGDVYQAYLSNPSVYANACALRLSYAINSAGEPINPSTGNYFSLEGDVNGDYISENYLLRALDLESYVQENFATSSSITISSPRDIPTGAEGFIVFEDVGQDINGDGIYEGNFNHIDYYYGGEVMGDSYFSTSTEDIARRTAENRYCATLLQTVQFHRFGRIESL